MARLDDKDLGSLVDRVVRSTGWGAQVVDVRGRSLSKHPLSLDDKHSCIAESLRFVALAHHNDEEFVLDVWERW